MDSSNSSTRPVGTYKAFLPALTAPMSAHTATEHPLRWESIRLYEMVTIVVHRAIRENDMALVNRLLRLQRRASRRDFRRAVNRACEVCGKARANDSIGSVDENTWLAVCATCKAEVQS